MRRIPFLDHLTLYPKEEIMKRDPDLIKTILQAYEDLPYPSDYHPIVLDQFPQDAINYHQEILVEAGFIKAEIETTIADDVHVYPIRLTNAGHEFLDAARNDNAWSHVKTILEGSGGFMLSVAKDLLVKYIIETTIM